MRRGHGLADLVMAGPAIVMYVFFLVIPIALGIYLSLTNWTGLTMDADFVGLANYVRAVQDLQVVRAATTTVFLTVAGTALANVLGLILAVALVRSSRVAILMRTIVFYPYVIAPIIVGFLWSALLGSYGIINTATQLHGDFVIPFLSDASWARWTLLAVGLWAHVGLHTVIYLAGLQTIPESLIEAARVDGANGWQRFRHVTLPSLSSVVTVNVLLALLYWLNTYDLVVSLTNGGPAGETETVAFVIFSSANPLLGVPMSYAAAQAVMLAVTATVAVVAVTLLRRLLERKALA